jgi:hypothetical protein
MINRRKGLMSVGTPERGEPVLLRQVIERLRAAGILPDDPGLAAWRAWNAHALAEAQAPAPEEGGETP